MTALLESNRDSATRRSAPIESADDALEAVDARPASGYSRPVIADVPLGAFLSGGRFSLIVALMQEASPRPIKTF